MIVVLVIFSLIVFYLYATRNYNYWTKRNVKNDPPIPLFGNNFKNYFGYKSTTEIATELYNKYPDEKVVGFYRGVEPELLVKDLDLIRNVLSVDFQYFYTRGLGRNPSVEPLSLNLFSVEGDKWKLLRQRLTAAFTTAKLKSMFPLVINCAEKMQQLLGEEIIAKGGECDVRELMARFTTEFIGSCGFGIEMDTINNEHSLFRKLGKRIFNITFAQFISLVAWELFPHLRKVLYAGDRQVENVISQLLSKVREQRNLKPSGRNDFIDLLLELEAKGKITGESVEKRSPDGTPIEVEMDMDFKCMAAQVFVFFAAGFETSSSTTSFTLHQLAHHPEIQNKIQEQIDEVLLKYNNKLCYDAIAEMSLLDMAFKEAMRIFPSLGILNRVCSRRYKIPELGITIDPGVKILIPIQAIQLDEKYFDNPLEFRPERFSPEEVKDRNKYAYLPFGEGPRQCIGTRLGQMQSLAGLSAILQKFNVEPSAKTTKNLRVSHTHNIVQSVQGGLPLRLSFRRKD